VTAALVRGYATHSGTGVGVRGAAAAMSGCGAVFVLYAAAPRSPVLGRRLVGGEAYWVLAVSVVETLAVSAEVAETDLGTYLAKLTLRRS
jgi:hypothetical protein